MLLGIYLTYRRLDGFTLIHCKQKAYSYVLLPLYALVLEIDSLKTNKMYTLLSLSLKHKFVFCSDKFVNICLHLNIRLINVHNTDLQNVNNIGNNNGIPLSLSSRCINSSVVSFKSIQ